MSHSAAIDYQALSIKARITCEQALKQLCKLDSLIDKIKETSSTLQTQKIKDFESYLIKQKDTLSRSINFLVRKTQQPHRDESVVQSANNLAKQVNDLTAAQLMNLEDMINGELQQVAQNQAQAIHDEIYGVMSLDSTLISQINAIDDMVLRESVYRVAVNKDNKSLSWEKILELGKVKVTQRTDQLIAKNKDQIIQELTQELKEAKVEETIIKKVMSGELNNSIDVEQLRQKVTHEIVNESVRKETLKVIIKTIEDREFIVDRKNIKLNRDANEVRLVAMKVSGERAEFRIFLDGKFIYTFDGYEGQACQKDIQPFMKDLADIYDIQVVKQVDNWSNPDKLTTMKYQTYDKNKGTR